MDWMGTTTNRLATRIPLQWGRSTETAHAAEAAWDNVALLLERITAGELTWAELPNTDAPAGRVRVPAHLMDALEELTSDQRGTLMGAALRRSDLWTPSPDPAGLRYLGGVTVLRSPDGAWIIRRAVVLGAQDIPLRQSSSRPHVRWLNLTLTKGGDTQQLWRVQASGGGQPFLIAASSLRQAWERASDPSAHRWDVSGERLQELIPLRPSI